MVDDESAAITVHGNEQKDMPKQRSWIKYVIGDPYAPDDPQDLSVRRKNLIIIIIALSGISGPLASLIYLPGLLSVAHDLNTSMEAVNASVSTYVVFMGVAVKIPTVCFYWS